MTEVEYGGGGQRTRLGEIIRSTCVFRGAPAPIYKGGRERPALEGRAKFGESY